jgi:predicted signal transduction protein with EAL and GGDEF domain
VAYAGPAVRSVEGLRITSSFGIAVFDTSIEDPGQLIDLADQALYVAKKSGRNRVTVYGTAVEVEPANAPPAPNAAEPGEVLEAEAA